jgi:hypothetical protein
VDQSASDQRWDQSPSKVHQSTNSSKRQAILVLGMHRSGTSALGGVLSALGVAGPKTQASPNEWNPRGYFESQRIFTAHDELLASIGSCWDDWRQLDPQWLQAKAGQQREAIKALLLDEFGNEPQIFIKDPRICRFVPFIFSILAELNFRTVAVLPLRSPIEVAHSLKRRDKIAMPKSILMWLRHVLDAEFYSRQMSRCFLSYESLLIDWRRQMERVAKNIGIRWPDHSDHSNITIREFLTTDLRHERSSPEELENHSGVSHVAKDTYDILMRMACSGESQELLNLLDLVRTKFDEECELVG